MPARNDDLAATLGNLLPQEMEAIWLGALLTVRLGNDENAKVARRLLAALEAIRASTIDGTVIVRDLEVSDITATSQALAHHLDMHALRQGLIHEMKLRIAYIDAKGRATERFVWPLDVQDYGPNGAMLAYCEKREDFRNFRFDRITEPSITQQRFEAPRGVMLALFEALQAGRGDDDE
jgi:predicted DNA-binding transcriptional regulator YafY